MSNQTIHVEDGEVGRSGDPFDPDTLMLAALKRALDRAGTTAAGAQFFVGSHLVTVTRFDFGCTLHEPRDPKETP